jgi:ABC-type multidrug transport system permease subunit
MSHRLTPLIELTRARIREFFREPAAIFWVYGFPLIIAVSLGIAFREKPQTQISVDLVERDTAAGSTALREALTADGRFTLHTLADEGWRKRLRDGKTDLVIIPPTALDSPESPPAKWELWQEPRRAESLLARQAVENVLMRQQGQTPPPIQDQELSETGSRYIDFLVPGLLGINLMGGGLFGVGFVLVDMRVKKLLKRFLATPLRHGDFLLSVMLSRLLFMLPEICALLGLSWLLFGVQVQGSLLSLAAVILLGGLAFAGLGLLIASRATTLETASGLLNLLMLPMYVLSGVFFSSDRFPDAVQPLIRALPLTALNDALRGVMLEGLTLPQLWRPLLTLVAWGIVSFAVALKIFRW